MSDALQGKKLEHKERDEKQVKAYYKAWNAMEDAVRAHRRFDEELIEHLHTLVEGATKPIPYRNCQNAVYDSVTGAKIYLPPEFSDVPFLMHDLCEWAQKAGDMPVPLVAGIVHYQFVTIHPYLDGNGRTARLLASFIMRAGGYDLKGIYSLEEYYAHDLNAYYNVLQTYPHHNCYYGRHEADITEWLAYFIGGVADAFEKVNHQAEKQAAYGLTVDKSPFIRDLDMKQRRVLELFAQFKGIDSSQVAALLNVSAQSARHILRRWIAQEFLQYANESKKARTYRLSEEYEKLIK